MKQTAVEWFFPKIMGIGLSLELGKITNDDYHKEIAKVFEQAKEMEKEQIVESYSCGYDDSTLEEKGSESIYRDGKDYYNETFKSE